MAPLMQDLAFAIPGVDEAMGFAEIMKLVKSMEYSVVCSTRRRQATRCAS